MSKSDIVISGISGRWPKSDNLDQLWFNLKQSFPLYDKDDNPYTKLFPIVTKSRGALNNPKLFDSQFFGYSESDAAELDAQFRILHETVYESLWDAGIIPEDWRSTRTGFFVGSFIDDVDTVVNWDKRADFLQLSATRIPYIFNFTGPTVRLDTACASSLTALHEAVNAIKTGQCDQAIVAGLSIHQRLGTVIEGCDLELFAKSGVSRCLDADADGYVRCEAIVSLVLQKATQAKRMYATIRGSAINADGYTLGGITTPRPEAQKSVMSAALTLASIDPLDVDYIEAHLTSTQAGDVAECSSILAAYRPNSVKPITLGCIKSNLGHSEAASGLTAIAKAIKIFQTKMIPPNIGLVSPNPKIDGLLDGRLVPVSDTITFNGKYIGVNSFGFGGANAHVIISCDAPDYRPSNSSPPINYRLVFLCNRTIQGINKMIEWIQCEPKAIREDCLSLLDDISLTTVSTGISARAFVLINNQGNIIKQSKTLIASNQETINLTVKLDSSLTNYMKILSNLKPFNDSIASCYQYYTKSTDLTADITLIISYIGIIDLLTSLGLKFNLIVSNPVYLSTLNDYKDGKLSRREAISCTRRVKENIQSNGELKTNGPKGLSSTIKKASSTINSPSEQLTLHLSSNLILTFGNGNKLLESTDNLNLDDWLVTFYSTLGILYLNGLTIKLSSIYPTYNYPVARDCPSLSGLIRWSHTIEFPVLERYSHYFELPKRTIHRVDLLDPEYFSVADHVIDDRVVFPATGYIFLVRKHLALIHYGPFTDIFTFSFKVWNVNILQAAFITEPIEFIVNYDPTSQAFEITSSGKIYATGFGSIILPTPTLNINTTTVASTSSPQETGYRFDYGYIKTIESEEMDLSHEEFYQEMAISGYRYLSAYQNVVSAKITRSSAVLNYTKDWMALADNFLQLEAFWLNERKLMVPIKIGEMKFDVDIFKSMLTTGQEMIKVYSTKPGSVGTNGLFFDGIEVKEFPVKGQQDRLRIGQQSFCPLFNDYIQLDEQLVKLRVKYCELCLSSLEKNSKIDQSEIENLFDQLNASTLDHSPDLLNLLNKSIDSSSDRVNYILSELNGNNNNQFIDNLISLIPTDCVHPLVDLVAENNRRELKVSIQNYGLTSKMLKKLIQSQFNAICKGCVFIDETISKSSDRKMTNNQSKTGSEMILTVYKHRSVDLLGGSTIDYDYDESSIISTMRGNFCLILIREKLSQLEEKIANYCQLKIDCDLPSTTHKLRKLMDNESNYVQIGSTFCQEMGLRCILYRCKPKPTTISSHQVIKITGSSECFWFDEIKRTLDHLDQVHRLWLIADESSQNGLLGLTNCLSLEPVFSNKIRCIFSPDKHFNQSTDLTEDLINRDLLINVYSDGVWGFYRTVDMSFDFQQRFTSSPYVCLETTAKSDGKVLWIQNDSLIRKITDDPSIVNDLISVSYSALNFRDILLVNGLMPPNAYPDKSWYRLGIEFSGYHKGQRVMGLSGGNSFSTFISPSDPFLITMKVPDHWTMAQAATIPICYMTVVYGLIIRGNLQPGETVLIHAGSGGVGLAAISICLSLGCKIFTTVSTISKQHAVQRLFPQLPDESFTDSRSTKFEEVILKRTNGRGVDIVLNSLIHDKFDAGLRILAENGRFLDLSKVDIYEDRIFDRMDLQPNISVHAVCLATLVAAQRIDEINKIIKIIEDGIVDGMVIPLPYKVYHHSEVSASFTELSSAKHVGKIIVQLKDDSRATLTSSPVDSSTLWNDCLSISCIKKTVFDSTKSYLIIGGLGGMGLELALWMVERGARKMVITSRSGIKTNYQRFAIRRIRSIGATKVEISRLDAAHGKSALRLIREASRLGPIGGIFNLAVVLKDGLFPNQTLDAFRAVGWPKIEATRNMDILSRQHCPFIDYFVCFSSVASQGNLGQSNYGYANSYMERVCETRRKDGLPGLAIQWGPVGDVGVAVRTMGNKSSVAGYEPQRIRSCLEALDIFLLSSISVGFSAIPIIDKDENDPQDALVRVSRIIGVKDIRVINLKLRLRDLGMDSVQAIEVQEYLEQNFNFSLGAASIYDLTLENLVKIASVEIKTVDMEVTGLDKIFRPLKKTGQRPVFFFPPAIFDFLGMLPLARGLDRQVFGIDFTDDNEIAKDWQTLTDYYCSRVLDQWPNEPTYDFLSYSLGAAFAYEVARKIKALRGENSVRKIVFIDSTPNGIQQALAWSVKLSETVGNVSIDKEALMAFLKRMDRKQGNSWRARTFKHTQKASNFDLTEDLLFKKYQYIAEMKIEPKLKADALFFKCKHTVSSFEGSIAVSLDKSIDGHIETILVDSNHAEIITQCKDLLISECNKFFAL